MEPVGFCGIIKLTTHILHRNLKHFLCIAFILVLQDAFLPAVSPIFFNNTSQSLAHTLSLLYDLYAFQSTTAPSPDPYTPTPQPQHFPLLITTLFVLSIFVTLLVQPPLTFSVCRAVLNKSLDLKSSVLAIPRSALNLILTVLCVAGVLLGFIIAMMIPMIIVVAAMLANGIDSFMLVVAIWRVVTVGGCLYLGIAWSLASTVAILEEKRGWQAIKRSMYLVDGSKWVIFSLRLVLGGCMMFLPITASDEASMMWRWSCMVLSVGLQAMIELFNMASMVVLYLSCKSRFNEPLNTLIALTPQFGPLETSAKYMDLDSARVDIA